MRTLRMTGGAIALAAVAALPATAWDDPPQAQAPAPPAARQPATTNVIGTHQINRYAAIQQLQEDLKAKPDNLADWLILGELALEVAEDLPDAQAEKYHTMSRQAFEKALALDPDNAGLKAAVQFAKDREANAEALAASRTQATTNYLAARRRELAQPGASPTVQVYTSPPVTTMRTLPAPRANLDPNVAPAGATVTTYPVYPQPVYQPYYTPQGQPYTYQQYSNSYYPPGSTIGTPNGSATTLRQYIQQFPRVMTNQFNRAVTPVAPTTTVPPR